MPVTVDHELLEIEPLGLRTVGQVLSHVQRENRLVVHLLIDGREPEMTAMGDVRKSLINGHTLFIETAEPRQMALEVIDEVEDQLFRFSRILDAQPQLAILLGDYGLPVEGRIGLLRNVLKSASGRSNRITNALLAQTVELLRGEPAE